VRAEPASVAQHETVRRDPPFKKLLPVKAERAVGSSHPRPLESDRLHQDLADLILRWLEKGGEDFAQRQRLENEERVNRRERIERLRGYSASYRQTLARETKGERIEIIAIGVVRRPGEETVASAACLGKVGAIPSLKNSSSVPAP
jgi:hypothetical protein